MYSFLVSSFNSNAKVIKFRGTHTIIPWNIYKFYIFYKASVLQETQLTSRLNNHEYMFEINY